MQNNIFHGEEYKMKRRINKYIWKIKNSYHSSEERFLYMSSVSGIFNICLGLGKIISGILSFSLFACMNGGYTLTMALAKYCAIIGAVRTSKKKEQYKYYHLSGIIMMLASILYVGYSVWGIFYPKTVNYGNIIAITIAAITFTEIGFNLYGVVKYRKNNIPLLHALKMISLATSLISLVLTQSAILSFADDTQNPSANGLLGTIMGVIAILMGIYMIKRIDGMKEE